MYIYTIHIPLYIQGMMIMQWLDTTYRNRTKHRARHRTLKRFSLLKAMCPFLHLLYSNASVYCHRQNLQCSLLGPLTRFHWFLLCSTVMQLWLSILNKINFCHLFYNTAILMLFTTAPISFCKHKTEKSFPKEIQFHGVKFL